MNTFKTKKDFMAALEKELKNFNVSDKTEILSDFDAHFEESLANGFTEEEICQKLGDINEITEIAKQYSNDETDIYYRPETETDNSSGEEKTNPAFQEFNKTFSDSFLRIDVGVVMAQTVFGLSGDNNTYINYKSSRAGVAFTADIRGGKLEVKERVDGMGSWLFGLTGLKSTLEILVPNSVYENVEYYSVSGNSEIDRIRSSKWLLRSTSGATTACLGADDLEISLVSGKCEVTNCADAKMSKLKVHTISGNSSVKGFSPNSYEVNSTSGTVEMDLLSGSGKLSVISGKANLTYKEWNGPLDIRIVSGNVNIGLPENSGAELDFARVSGIIKYTLGNDKGSCRKNGEYSFGGTNRQQMDVSTTTGSITICEVLDADCKE